MEINKLKLLFLLILLASFGFSLYYNYSLEKQVKERDALILNMSKDKYGQNKTIDTITQEILKEVTYITNDGERLTSEDIIRYTNSLINEMNLIQDSLRYYKAYYELSQRNYNHTFKEEKTLFSSKYEFVGSVPDTIQIEKMKKELKNLIVENHKQEKALDHYGIVIRDIPNSNEFTYYSQKVDSAMVLLPYYRDKLKLSNDGKSWIITYTTQKEE